MDRNYIEQNDIARQYMQGRLTPEEAADFEVYLMDKPELVEEMELDGLLGKHIEQTSSVKKIQTNFLFSWLPAGVLRYVSVTVVAFGLGVLVNNISIDNGFQSLSSGGNIYYLSNLRGNNTDFVEKVKLEHKHDFYIFVLQPELQNKEFQKIKIELLNSKEDFTKIIEVFPNNSGDIVIPISVEALQAGNLKISHYFEVDKVGDEFMIVIEN